MHIFVISSNYLSAASSVECDYEAEKEMCLPKVTRRPSSVTTPLSPDIDIS